VKSRHEGRSESFFSLHGDPYEPKQRLILAAISTHHREYGFPSSHSTNSISIALFAAGWLWQEREAAGWGWVLFGWTGMYPRREKQHSDALSLLPLLRDRCRWARVHWHALDQYVCSFIVRGCD